MISYTSKIADKKPPPSSQDFIPPLSDLDNENKISVTDNPHTTTTIAAAQKTNRVGHDLF